MDLSEFLYSLFPFPLPSVSFALLESLVQFLLPLDSSQSVYNVLVSTKLVDSG